MPPLVGSGFSTGFRGLRDAIALTGRMASFLLPLSGERVREVNGTMRWKAVAKDAKSICEDLEKLGQTDAGLGFAVTRDEGLLTFSAAASMAMREVRAEKIEWEIPTAEE